MSITKNEFASKFGEHGGEPVHAVTAIATYQQLEDTPSLAPQSHSANQLPITDRASFEHNITEQDFTIEWHAMGDSRSCLYR